MPKKVGIQPAITMNIPERKAPKTIILRTPRESAAHPPKVAVRATPKKYEEVNRPTWV